MFANIITPILLLAAFILLLLVSLSIPIIKSIDLLRLSANVKEGVSIVSATATGQVKFGVWGYCISAVDVEVAGHSIDTAAQCSKVHLGYTFDSTVANALQASGISSSDLSKGITAALVIHPIACGLTFLAFTLSLFALCARPSRITRPHLGTGLTLAATLLAAVFTTIVFLIDVIFVPVVRSKVRNATDGQVTATWGSGTWMALAAAVLLWIASVSSCCGVFTRRSRGKQDTY